MWILFLLLFVSLSLLKMLCSAWKRIKALGSEMLHPTAEAKDMVRKQGNASAWLRVFLFMLQRSIATHPKQPKQPLVADNVIIPAPYQRVQIPGDVGGVGVPRSSACKTLQCNDIISFNAVKCSI